MRYHRISAPELTCSAKAGACLVWTAVTEATLEVGAAPVPLDLLGVDMPVSTLSYPAENGRPVVEIDDFVAVVVAILQGSTATTGLQDWLLCDGLDNWLDGGLSQRGIEEGRGNTVSLASITDTRR